ncbi:MAG: hypothetical protein V3V06_05650 [Dehalococcoidia bacterium]
MRPQHEGAQAQAVPEPEEVEFVEAPPEEVRAQTPLRQTAPRAVPAGRGRSRRRQRTLIDEERRFASAAWRWAVILVLALVVGTLILAWTAIQVTNRDNAERILKEALVPITEVDDLVARDHSAIIAEARASGAAEIPVLHYPIEITIPREELAVMSREELRARLLSESAERIYERGISAFQREPGASADGGIFSARGVIRLTVGQLTKDSHQIAQIIGGALVFVVAILLLAVVSMSRGLGRVQNVGVALAIVSAPMTIAAVGLRFALRTVADSADDPFNEALLDIGADVTWILIRNFITFAILGLLIIAAALVARIWAPRTTIEGALGTGDSL